MSIIDSIMGVARKEIDAKVVTEKTEETIEEHISTPTTEISLIEESEQVSEDMSEDMWGDLKSSIHTENPIANSDDPIVPSTAENRANMFNSFMDNIDTERMEISEEDKANIKSGLTDIESSFLGIIKSCDAGDCNHVNICPFNKIGRYPNGQPCPLEKCIAQHSTDEYFKLLQEEIASTKFNIIEINTIHSLVEIEVHEFRARTFINEEGLVTRFAAFAVRRTGEIIYNASENPVYNIMEKLSRRKHRLLQRLLLTPEAKAKYHIDSNKNRKDKAKEIILRAEEKIRQFREGDMNGNSTKPAK